MCSRLALTVHKRYILRALKDDGCAAAATRLLEMSMTELGLELTAIRTRLGVSSTAAALTYLHN